MPLQILHTEYFTKINKLKSIFKVLLIKKSKLHNILNFHNLRKLTITNFEANQIRCEQEQRTLLQSKIYEEFSHFNKHSQ